MTSINHQQVCDFFEGDGFGVSKFARLVGDENSAYAFARLSKLINLDTYPNCDKCGQVMKVVAEPKKKCRFLWSCSRTCRNRVSVTHNTIFDGSRISVLKALELMLNWFLEVPVTSAAGQVGVSKEGAISWYYLCRQICEKITATENICIGGPGLTVEIDESHKCHRKYHRGRVLASEHVWIFGGICRETKEGFLQIVPNRKGETLWPIIQTKIHPESIIMHDGARVYNQLDLPQHGGFEHYEVNHSQNFVDPNDPNIHTNTIERRWGLVKGKIKGFPGEEKMDVYLGEYLYREHHLKVTTDRERRFRGVQFQVFLNDAQKVFPGFAQIGV